MPNAVKSPIDYIVTGDSVSEATEAETTQSIEDNLDKLFSAINEFEYTTNGSKHYIKTPFGIGFVIGLVTSSRPELTVSYPDYKSVQFATILDGSDILAQFPGEVDVRYNSIALYNHLDDPIAYRRVSVKSISNIYIYLSIYILESVFHVITVNLINII